MKLTSKNIIGAAGLWNLESEPVKQIYDTTWQLGEKYILKTYSDKEMMKRNIEIMKILDSEGIPVGKIVPDSKGNDYAEYGGQYYFISTKLAGNNLVKEYDNMELAATSGKVIAKLHIALKECEKKIDVWDNSLLMEMKGWIYDSFQKNDWQYISREEYEAVIKKLEVLYDELPRQLIHRDVHFGNFLFDNGRFSGYIDFDLSQRNIRIFDLCYFLLGLLAEADKYKISREQWILFAKEVFEGYESEIQLSNDEKKAVPYVMEAIELLFTAYYSNCHDEQCAGNAFNIYEFIKKTSCINLCI